MEKEIQMKKEEMKRCAGEAVMLINQFMSGDMTEENEKKIDELSQANLVYLMDRKINTDGDFEKEILADYKKKYCNFYIKKI